MPFKSDKQRKFMNWAAEYGKLDKKVVEKFNEESKGKDLPKSKLADYLKKNKKKEK